MQSIRIARIENKLLEVTILALVPEDVFDAVPQSLPKRQLNQVDATQNLLVSVLFLAVNGNLVLNATAIAHKNFCFVNHIFHSPFFLPPRFSRGNRYY